MRNVMSKGGKLKMALRYTGYMMPSKSYHNHEPIYNLFCVATTAESLNSKDIWHVLVIED